MKLQDTFHLLMIAFIVLLGLYLQVILVQNGHQEFVMGLGIGAVIMGFFDGARPREPDEWLSVFTWLIFPITAALFVFYRDILEEFRAVGGVLVNEELRWAAAVVLASMLLVIISTVLNLEDLERTSIAFLRVSMSAMTFLMMLNIVKRLANMKKQRR